MRAGAADLPEPLGADAWDALDAADRVAGEFWDVAEPEPRSRGRPRAARRVRAASSASSRGRDPLTTLRAADGASCHARFEYSPQSTRVDSPIDEALATRRGRLPGLRAHHDRARARSVGIPCRYVSGYLFQPVEQRRSRSADGATHAWVEAWLPELGWVGFDPTNNVVAGERHIRVAIGRDYADVPPTRGVFKGVSAVRSELAVAVSVGTGQRRSAADDAAVHRRGCRARRRLRWRTSDPQHQQQQQ